MPILFIPVILCGGAGSRLWPASQEGQPKQFLADGRGVTMLQRTAARIARISGKAGSVIAVTHRDHVPRVEKELSDAGLHGLHILGEPCRRNTAAAVALAALYAQKHFGDDALLWIAPADHHIADEGALKHTLQTAAMGAMEGRIVIFGIKPDRPETAYGYIRMGDGTGLRRVAQFVEKPDVATAQTLAASPDWLWNSGMVMARAGDLLAQYRLYASDILDGVMAAEHDPERYASLPAQPFDKAILEKSDTIAALPCDLQWSDIGSWQSLWDMAEKDGDGNAVSGDVLCIDTKDCLVMESGRTIICAGVQDLVVVEREGVLVIADRRKLQGLGDLQNIVRQKRAGGLT